MKDDCLYFTKQGSRITVYGAFYSNPKEAMLAAIEAQAIGLPVKLTHLRPPSVPVPQIDDSTVDEPEPTHREDGQLLFSLLLDGGKGELRL